MTLVSIQRAISRRQSCSAPAGRISFHGYQTQYSNGRSRKAEVVSVFWAWRISGWRGRSIGRGKLVVPKVPRLSFIRHRQSGLPKRTIARGKFCAANSVSFNRVFFQRSAVGRRDQALRRQNAGGRAACNSSRADEFGARRLSVVLWSVPLRTELNSRDPM